VTDYLRIPTEVGTFDALVAGPPSGRPVMLLHGFPEASVQWTHQVGALGAAGYYVIAPDQRGYSPDVRPAAVEEYRLDELVADVLRIADTMAWPMFDLIGHDWGAVVGWERGPPRIRTGCGRWSRCPCRTRSRSPRRSGRMRTRPSDRPT